MMEDIQGFTKSGYVLDFLPESDVDVHVDDRGVGHVEAITLREGPMRYVRETGPRWEMVTREGVKEAAETAMAAPVTNGHPEGFVDIQSIDEEAKGLSDTEVELITTEDDLLALKQHLMITDPDLVREIKAGKTQVSTGREVDFERSPGRFRGTRYEVIQRNPRINHIAIVDTGRCGPACSIESGKETFGQQEFSGKTERCIQEVKQEGKSKSEAIAICREQLNDATSFRNRIFSLLDSMQDRNGEIIRRASKIVKRDPQEIENVIAGIEEPDLSVLNALAQVLGITQARIKKWARQEFGKKVFDRRELKWYSNNEMGSKLSAYTIETDKVGNHISDYTR